jgi:hypothetical protein
MKRLTGNQGTEIPRKRSFSIFFGIPGLATLAILRRSEAEG